MEVIMELDSGTKKPQTFKLIIVEKSLNCSLVHLRILVFPLGTKSKAESNMKGTGLLQCQKCSN